MWWEKSDAKRLTCGVSSMWVCVCVCGNAYVCTCYRSCQQAREYIIYYIYVYKCMYIILGGVLWSAPLELVRASVCECFFFKSKLTLWTFQKMFHAYIYSKIPICSAQLFVHIQTLHELLCCYMFEWSVCVCVLVCWWGGLYHFFCFFFRDQPQPHGPRAVLRARVASDRCVCIFFFKYSFGHILKGKGCPIRVRVLQRRLHHKYICIWCVLYSTTNECFVDTGCVFVLTTFSLNVC